MRWVEGLSPAAHRLLQNIEQATRNLPGTQEARRLMRFDTQALRMLFGLRVCLLLFLVRKVISC